MKLKAVIFDLDGVIVDTARYHFLAWKKLADEIGADFDASRNELLKGVSRMQSLEIMLERCPRKLSAPEKEALAHRKNENYVALINQLQPEEIFPGARELLLHLRAHGIQCALASASQNAHTVLDRLQIAPCFNAVITGHEATKSKPHPMVFELAAEALGVAPEACIVIEDAAAGIEAARAAHMKCVGLGDPQSLAKADKLIRSLEELDVGVLESLM